MASKYASLEQLRKGARKDWTGPSGNTYLIRRLTPFEFVGVLELIPDVQKMAALPSDQAGSKVMEALGPERAALFAERMEKVVLGGVEQPPVTDVRDIPPVDLVPLFTEICDLSGQSAEEGKKLRPTRRRRR